MYLGYSEPITIKLVQFPAEQKLPNYFFSRVGGDVSPRKYIVATPMVNFMGVLEVINEFDPFFKGHIETNESSEIISQIKVAFLSVSTPLQMSHTQTSSRLLCKLLNK